MIHNTEYLINKIEDAIKSMPLAEEPQSLYEPIQYILSLGGKRVRPLLTLMASNLFTNEVDVALSSAMAIEVFHNFTLLHDDLMDKSNMRRGEPTVHKKWNANTAILSGDAMLIEAYKYIADVSPEVLPKALSLFTKTSMEVCEGQQYDMDFEERNDVSVDEYIAMIRLKTAVLLGCSLKLGAIVSNSSDEDSNNLYDFGINIGLAFQLKDDLLDIYGESAKFGKKLGGDILNNKKTFLLIKALELSDDIQRKELQSWITAEVYDDSDKIAAVKKIYDALNLKKVAENLMKKYYLAALNSLSAVSVSNERKKGLIYLADSLMNREL